VPWGAILANRSFLALCLMYAAQGYGWWFNITYLPQFLEHHYGMPNSSLLGALYKGGPLWMGAIGSLLGGLITDRIVRRTGNLRLGRRLCGFAGHAVCVACFLACPFAPNAFLFFLAVSLADSMTLARHAHAAGADGIAAVTPSYFGVTDREMEEWFVAIAGSLPADYPVYLYNIPQLAVNDLTPVVIERVVARCPNVVGIKYSGMDFIRISDYLKIRGGNFSVVIGGDRLAIAGAAMGCDGVVTGTCCAVPELYVRLWNAIRRGEVAEAALLQRVQQEYSALVKHGGSMPLIKQALMLRGVFQDVFTRPPLLPPSPQEAADFTRAFNTWRLTSSPASPGCCSS
jgi:4-hydroxy-tetrahydrodipicolinate synthase